MELEDDVSRGHPSRSHAAQPDFPFPFPSLAHRAHRVDPAPSTGMSIGRRPRGGRRCVRRRASAYSAIGVCNAQHSRAKKSVRLVTAKHNCAHCSGSASHRRALSSTVANTHTEAPFPASFFAQLTTTTRVAMSDADGSPPRDAMDQDNDSDGRPERSPRQRSRSPARKVRFR